MAAFVFARMKFRGKDLVFTFLTLGLMFPITVAMMPVYLVVRQMQLTDTLIGVILVQTAFGISANLLILRGFFRSRSQRAAGRRGHRRLQPLRLLLAGPAAFGRPALAAVAALTHDCQLE